ncbi:MAG: hypothetical protein WCS94_22425 [Verrucomicrobiota bacterium]
MPLKPLRRSKKVSRQQAVRIAQAYVCQQILGKAPRVVDSAKAVVRAYNVPTKDTWVIYRNPTELAFKSSEIILVSKRSGKIIYDGPAHDEG